jgi:hypothetical protein
LQVADWCLGWREGLKIEVLASPTWQRKKSAGIESLLKKCRYLSISN